MRRHLSPAEATSLHSSDNLVAYYNFDNIVDYNVTNVANPTVNNARLGFFDSEMETLLPEQYRPFVVPR